MHKGYIGAGKERYDGKANWFARRAKREARRFRENQGVCVCMCACMNVFGHGYLQLCMYVCITSS